MAKWYGFGAPFVGGQENILSRQEDERLIKNDIRALLLTLPGERIYRSDYGCLLRSYVFELLGQGDLPTVEDDVREAVERWEERVTVDSVTATLDEAEQLLTVTVVVRPNDAPQTTYLISLNLTPSGSEQSGR